MTERGNEVGLPDSSETEAAAWDAPDGTRWVQTLGQDEWTGWVPGEDGCWLYSGDEFRRSYPQWEDAVLAADGAPERVAAIERELRSAVDDVRMTDTRCPSVSSYGDLQCDLPDTREAHPKGHQHKRRMSATRFDTETVIWGIGDADAERWGDA